MNHSRAGLSRRDFIRASAGLAASAYVFGLSGCRPAAGSPSVPVGLQLYSVRHDLEADLPGTLSRLAEMGYEGVEFADYYGRSAAELRALLDDNDLRCCGTHIYMDDMLGDRLQETVEFNQELGNQYLIVRWLNEDQRNTREAFLRTADRFNEIAENLEPYGMRVGYHNHDYIFETFDGELLWDILAANTRSDVILQLDTGHAAGIGQDPVDLIRRHPGRTVTMHVKPHSSSSPGALLGEDELDWDEVFRAAEETGGLEWYILEYEEEAVPPMEAMRTNLQNFQAMRAT